MTEGTNYMSVSQLCSSLLKKLSGYSKFRIKEDESVGSCMGKEKKRIYVSTTVENTWIENVRIP